MPYGMCFKRFTQNHSAYNEGRWMILTALKAVVWPAVAWIVADVLLYIAVVADATAADVLGGNPSLVTGLALAIAIWAGAAVKQANGKMWEAFVGGIVVGFACGVPAVLLFGDPTGFLWTIIVFSLVVAWAGWALK
jgi:hypothetical protein